MASQHRKVCRAGRVPVPSRNSQRSSEVSHLIPAHGTSTLQDQAMRPQGMGREYPQVPFCQLLAFWDAATHYRGAQAWAQMSCPTVNAWLGGMGTQSQLRSIACKDPGSDCCISSPISPNPFLLRS